MDFFLIFDIGVVVPQIGPPSKRQHREPTFIAAQPPSIPASVTVAPVAPPVAEPVGPVVPTLLNGNRNRVGLMARTGRKQVMSWMDAPDDLYFRSTVATK